jgi:two-component system, response regulator / RNA-binding antiterminator
MSRVLVLEFDTERLDILCEGLRAAGHHVVAPQATVSNLLRLVGEWSPDVVIIDTDSPDRDTLEHVLALSRENPRPVLMFSEDPDGAKIRSATAAGVSAYIVNGLAADRVQPIVDAAIARFQEMQALRAELAAARSAIEDRKLVERAKARLMDARGLTEQEAYRVLRTEAMNSSRRLVDVAREIADHDRRTRPEPG